MTKGGGESAHFFDLFSIKSCKSAQSVLVHFSSKIAQKSVKVLKVLSVSKFSSSHSSVESVLVHFSSKIAIKSVNVLKVFSISIF